jgi:aryl-alcohol dehydrogenase-like predicted oxidoreductase
MQVKEVSLILGTALWGWTVDNEKCYRLLDKFYAAGFRKIDTASNYPINRDPECYRFAENMLEEWIKSTGVEDLEIIVKIGSIDNSGSEENNLNFSFLLMNFDYYQSKFGKNLNNLTIHWDNRDNLEDIRDTVEALAIIRDTGVNIGLSGIKYPQIYYEASEEHDLCFTIQIKHNVFYSAYDHYRLFHDGNHKFIAYGINAGGIKRNQQYSQNSSAIVRNVNTENLHNYMAAFERLISMDSETGALRIENYNNLAMTYAFNSPGITGIIIGPSNERQLHDSLKYYECLVKHNSSEIYGMIVDIQKAEL